jgi:hypothetical protein
MSLVGPRPALPVEVARYGSHMRRRLAVKPGLTGLWQVSGRSGLSWEESFRLDLRYVDNWSMALDLQILWKTCSAVVRGHGACLALAASAPHALEQARSTSLRRWRAVSPAQAVALHCGCAAGSRCEPRPRYRSLVRLAGAAADAVPCRRDRDAERAG